MIIDSDRQKGSAISVLHAVPSLAESSGGPSRSVVGLVNNLAQQPDTQVTLLTQQVTGSILRPDAGHLAFILVQTSRWGAMTALPFAKRLHGILRGGKPHILHAHGIWNAASFWSCTLAKCHGVFLVLHPRGMLEPWCLRHKVLKKQFAMALYQRRLLKAVDLFVATSQQELDNIRALGFQQPIALIPNGVSLPCISPRDTNQDKYIHPRKALFLSRIHPVKGLLNLVGAWAQAAHADWKLVVAGPNEGDHWAEVRRHIDAQGVRESIEYVGPVEGEAKAKLFRQAELFILPSFSENFGIVVAEALAHGLPVITTTGTPWEGLVERGCGWWVEPTVEALAGSIQDATGKTPDELNDMGKKGCVYAEEFDWSNIARQTMRAYRWLLGMETRPECVTTD